jgi:hypothetical protein
MQRNAEGEARLKRKPGLLRTGLAIVLPSKPVSCSSGGMPPVDDVLGAGAITINAPSRAPRWPQQRTAAASSSVTGPA